MPAPFSDPALQYLSINDFTPGLHRYSRVATALNYSPNSPLGSAANSYRCIARQGVGLVPLPRYVLAQTHTATDAAQPVCLSMGNMLSLAPRGGAVGDLVCDMLIQHGHPEVSTDFNITRLPTFLSAGIGHGFTPVTVYSSTAAGFPVNTMSWPMMDYGTFQDPSTQAYARVVVNTDPISTSLTTNPSGPGKWVTVRGWTTPTGFTAPESSNGTFTLLGAIGSYPRVFYHANRMGIWQVGSAQTVTNGFISTDNDVLDVSNILNPSAISTAGTFFPEMGTFIGAWGSISTGELVGIYTEGGAILVYGDMYAPTQVIKLPGVAGTMGMVQRACLTSVGLVYCRYNEGAWVWNGDNTAQKLSAQIQDDVFDRTKQAQGFSSSPIVQTSMAKFGAWVLFPANYLFDTLTQSWWFIEDQTVQNFQVWCDNGAQGLFGSPGIAYAPAGGTATLNTYYWDFGTASSSYRWLSNPIPATQDALVTVALVEVVATNQTSHPCTVTVTPTVPAGQRAYQNQNDSQPVTFTIPPTTVAYRASQRLGFAYFNIQLQVDAANSNTADAAPILHQLNIGFSTTRTAGVQ